MAAYQYPHKSDATELRPRCRRPEAGGLAYLWGFLDTVSAAQRPAPFCDEWRPALPRRLRAGFWLASSQERPLSAAASAQRC